MATNCDAPMMMGGHAGRCSYVSMLRMPLVSSNPGPTQVLIVGVAHLDASVPDSALERGIGLLRRWQPDVIAIERLPGHLVVEYEQRGGAFEGFPVGGAIQAREGAETVLGARAWNVWRARGIARDEASPLTDRVIGWLLAREPCNALLLSWRQAELPLAAVDFLSRLAGSASETVRIGVRLAHELGHTELVHFDDHAGAEVLAELPDLERLSGDFYELFRDRAPRPPEPDGADSDAWLLWAWAASPAAREWLETIESTAMAVQPDPVLRARHVQWRTRNLAMASRLRAATALIPGGRLVAIVGHSHERPLRAALTIDQHDLVLTDITSLEN